MKDIKTITSKLKKLEVERKTRSITDTFDLVMVNIDLYPEEVLHAAQEALGEKAITEYYVEMYLFAIEALTQQTPIKVQQLNGVILTHKKIEKWLKKINASDAYNITDPIVRAIYEKEARKLIERGVDMLATLKYFGGAL